MSNLAVLNGHVVSDLLRNTISTVVMLLTGLLIVSLVHEPFEPLRDEVRGPSREEPERELPERVPPPRLGELGRDVRVLVPEGLEPEPVEDRRPKPCRARRRGGGEWGGEAC